jgi:Ca2+-binding RTX toxin-like protein
MPRQIVATDSRSTLVVESNYTFVYVPQDVSIIADDYGQRAIETRFDGSSPPVNPQIVNDGTLIALNESAIHVYAPIMNVLNGETGVIRGSAAGVSMQGPSGSSINSFTNHGQISGSVSGALLVGGSWELDFNATNTGTITGGEHALRYNGDLTFFNSGTLISDEVGLEESNSSYRYKSVIENTGTISGKEIGIKATTIMYLTNSGDIWGGKTALEANTLDLLNTGTIEAGASNGGAIQTGDRNDILTNTGLIRGYVQLEDGVDRFENRGELIGSVDLGEGNDVYTQIGGTITGFVAGGDGDDLYRTDDGTLSIYETGSGGTDRVVASTSFSLSTNVENLTLFGTADINGTGNASDNELIGNAGDNVLRGRGGEDTINGGGGDDRIMGGFGKDILNGDAGDDVIVGGTWGDQIKGGDDNDRLFGNQGRDVLWGDAGDDVIVGSQNADNLYGGTGADTFLYRVMSDSLSNEMDVIRDFVSGQDRLDFSALHSDTITLNLLGSFSGTGPSAITREVGAHSFADIDLNGDSTADMTIQLIRAQGLQESDFVL